HLVARGLRSRIDHFCGLHDPGEMAETAVDLAQPLLAVEIVGILRPVAERRGPRHDLDDLRAFDAEQLVIFGAQPREAFRRDEARLFRDGLGVIARSAATKQSSNHAQRWIAAPAWLARNDGQRLSGSALPKVARDVERLLLLTAASAHRIVDDAVFDHALHISLGLEERDRLDPLQHVDLVARIAVAPDPLSDIARAGVVAGDSERHAAVPDVQHALEVSRTEH